MSGSPSAIEWTTSTWNPVTGCDKAGHPYEQGFGLRLWPERLDTPLRWRKPRLVSVSSMSDLFHEEIPDEYIATVFGRMAAARQHTFQVLTKRPERMVSLLQDDEFARVMRLASGELGHDFPLPNVWLGVSIENRRFVDRADLLRRTPAAVRFISAEPLLGPLMMDEPHIAGAVEGATGWSDGYDGDELELAGIDWLIAGGESGPKHRPMDAQWVRDLRDACLATQRYPSAVEVHHQPMLAGERARGIEGTGTAFFFKQWGGTRPKSNGRELDGRTWDEFPAGATGSGTLREQAA